jgi:hypothetical protein
MTMSFVALSPIPGLKLTDQGLIDTIKLERPASSFENFVVVKPGGNHNR